MAPKRLLRAQEHLSRAQELISDKADRSSSASAGSCSWLARALQAGSCDRRTDALIDAFGDMGLLQEQAAVKLHKADLLRQQTGPSSPSSSTPCRHSVSLCRTLRSWLASGLSSRISRRSPSRLTRASPARPLRARGLTWARNAWRSTAAAEHPLRRGVEVLAYCSRRRR